MFRTRFADEGMTDCQRSSFLVILLWPNQKQFVPEYGGERLQKIPQLYHLLDCSGLYRDLAKFHPWSQNIVKTNNMQLLLRLFLNSHETISETTLAKNDKVRKHSPTKKKRLITGSGKSKEYHSKKPCTEKIPNRNINLPFNIGSFIQLSL